MSAKLKPRPQCATEEGTGQNGAFGPKRNPLESIGTSQSLIPEITVDAGSTDGELEHWTASGNLKNSGENRARSSIFEHAFNTKCSGIL